MTVIYSGIRPYYNNRLPYRENAKMCKRFHIIGGFYDNIIVMSIDDVNNERL